MHRLLASWFGTGLLPAKLTGSDDGAGTVGAALALVVALALRPLGPVVQLAVAIGVAGLSVWAAKPFAGDHADPSWVVIDEAAGTFLATVGLPVIPALVAFVVFRVADVGKEFFPGVALAERLPHSLGVTADDLVAGVYGLAAGWLVELMIR